MHDSVQVMDLKGGRVGVGIPKGTHRPNYTDESSKGNQLTVSEYANVLEHGSGSRNIKARPVFSDTYRKDMGGNAGLSKYMSWHIARGFRSVGIKLIKI